MLPIVLLDAIDILDREKKWLSIATNISFDYKNYKRVSASA